MIRENFFIYLLVMAGVTYLLRMIPMVLVRKKIKNRFILSFLYYIPYTVLSVMTVPAIFYATEFIPAVAGFAVAIFLGFKEKSLVTVAMVSCAAVLVVQIVMNTI